MDRYKEGYADADRKWRKRLENKKIEFYDKINGEDYYKYTDYSYNGMQYTIEVIKDLLKKG